MSTFGPIFLPVDRRCAERLSPLLAQHKLCVLPRVLERTASEQLGELDQRLVSITLKVAFDLVSADDGSSHRIEA